MSFAPGQVAWRFPIAFQIFFALIILAFVLQLPDSPRWLILKGREEEALNVLSALADKDPEDHLIQQEFAAIKDTVLLQEGAGFKDLFTMDEDRHFHRVVLAYVNQMFQQISGINLVSRHVRLSTNTRLTRHRSPTTPLTSINKTSGCPPSSPVSSLQPTELNTSSPHGLQSSSLKRSAVASSCCSVQPACQDPWSSSQP